MSGPDSARQGLDDQMSKFVVRRRPGERPQAAPAPSEAPADGAKAPVAEAPPQAPDQQTRPQNPPAGNTGRDSVDESRSDPEDDAASEADDAAQEGGDDLVITRFLPRHAQGKRPLRKVLKEIDLRWKAPKELTVQEARQYRSYAAMARVLDVLTSEGRFEIGKFLLHAKERIKHGQFTTFIRQAMDIHPRTATRYMRIAETFTDPHAVTIIGYDLALDLVKADAPQEVIDEIQRSGSREQAERIFERWQEDEQIASAWRGINDQAVEAFGRELALEYSKPRIPAELRRMARESENDTQARELLGAFHTACGEGLSPDHAVQAVKARKRGENPPRPVLPIRNLQTRFEALQGLGEVELKPEEQRSVKQIEQMLLSLTQALQGRKTS